jgi:murein DD-endopeptidase MepM/ murein hydrolase activator NlpD
VKILVEFILCCSFLLAFDVEVSGEGAFNGKTTLLEFKNFKDIKYEQVHYATKSFPILINPSNTKKSYALIPISYYEKSKIQELKIDYTDNNERRTKLLSININQVKYDKEEIHVNPSKVNPKAPDIKKLIAQEYHEAMNIYETVTNKSYIKDPFIMPIQSKITSAFGKARVYNGSLKGYHSGTDFRAKTGTNIFAANCGKVVLVKNRFYSGGTVLIDHGRGIYTCYFHMSAFNVKEGEMVKRGEILGVSGQSGRVTGPHLHFSARINAVQVDPLQLVSLMNNKILKGK